MKTIVYRQTFFLVDRSVTGLGATYVVSDLDVRYSIHVGDTRRDCEDWIGLDWIIAVCIKVGTAIIFDPFDTPK